MKSGIVQARHTDALSDIGSPPPADDFGATDPVVYRGAYEFSVPDAAEDFVPQHLAPEQVVKARRAGE